MSAKPPLDPHSESASRTWPSGHPLQVFRQENAAVSSLVAKIRDLILSLSSAAAPDLTGLSAQYRSALLDLTQITRHYGRKEQLFFAYLRKYAELEPARQMWDLDDKIRQLLRVIQTPWQLDDTPAANSLPSLLEEGTVLCDLVQTMLQAEEEGLLPHCEKLFTAADWVNIYQESPRFGYCLVSPGNEYQPGTDPPPRPVLESGSGQLKDLAIRLATGCLTADQFQALFDTLPCDVTFVDEDDQIVFYSDWPGRHFCRTPTIIGGKLADCHPPALARRLDSLLQEFRSGARDVSEAVSQREGNFYHVSYLAVRDPYGGYLGCVEMAQDITRWMEWSSGDPLPTYRDEANSRRIP